MDEFAEINLSKYDFLWVKKSFRNYLEIKILETFKFFAKFYLKINKGSFRYVDVTCRIWQYNG